MVIKMLLLPPWVMLILISIFFVGLSLLGVYLIRKRFDYSLLERHNDVAGFVFASIGAIYGVLLAFVVVAVWDDYNKANDQAKNEFAGIAAFYRDLNYYPNQDEIASLRTALYKYAASVIKDEYPAMAERKPSQATSGAALEVWHAAQKINPQNLYQQAIYSEILHDLNSMDQNRSLRLANALEMELPGIIWTALLIGAFVTMLFAVLFGMKNYFAQSVIVSLLALLIAVNFFIILELDHPFAGDIRIRPDSFLQIVEGKGEI